MWPLDVGEEEWVKSMSGESLLGENRMVNVDGEEGKDDEWGSRVRVGHKGESEATVGGLGRWWWWGEESTVAVVVVGWGWD